MARKIPVACPTCGVVRLLRPADARRTRLCRKCHLTEIAPLGWQATKARHGEKAAVRFLQTYRLDHPSALEQQMIDTLDRLGILYQREAWIEDPDTGKVYLVDFVLPGNRAIEVNGEWVHQYHFRRDAAKLDLLIRLGYEVLTLTDRDMQHPEFEQHVRGFACPRPRIGQGGPWSDANGL